MTSGTIFPMFPNAQHPAPSVRASATRVIAATVGRGMLALVLSATGRAQETAPQAPSTPVATQQDDGTIRIRLPTVTVRAEKEPENVQDAPVSVTAVTHEAMENAGVRSVSDAA